MSTYLFIDGAYLRRNYSDCVRAWFGSDGEIDFRELKATFAAQRAFFYDALDDEQRQNEGAVAHEARIKSDKAFFNNIEELDGYFVRLGSLGGRGNRQQKKVDILLAVEALDHAVRRNMDRAVLLTGDRDFEPLVHSLVQFGVHVEVAGDKKTSSRYLRHAADTFKRLSFDDYHRFSAAPLRARFPITVRSTNPIRIPEMNAYENGTFRGENVTLLRRRFDRLVMYYLYVEGFYGDGRALLLEDMDVQKLQLYFQLQHGDIEWRKQEVAEQ